MEMVDNVTPHYTVYVYRFESLNFFFLCVKPQVLNHPHFDRWTFFSFTLPWICFRTLVRRKKGVKLIGRINLAISFEMVEQHPDGWLRVPVTKGNVGPRVFCFSLPFLLQTRKLFCFSCKIICIARYSFAMIDRPVNYRAYSSCVQYTNTMGLKYLLLKGGLSINGIVTNPKRVPVFQEVACHGRKSIAIH